MINSNWEFKKSGDTSWLPAVVPGTVHTDLLKNHLIDDPFYGDNEKELQWIEKEEWEYRTNFSIDNALLEKENISLKFEGVDTYATIFLNDTLILKANNMFREWEIACKNLLKKEGNILIIKLQSPIKYDKKQASSLPYQLPDERAFSRKAPYQYGWDWGPRFATSGIWRPVHLIGWDKARIKNMHLQQKEITDTLAKITAIIEIESNTSFQGTIDLHISDYDKSYQKESTNFSIGLNTIRINFDIINPWLWWTNGLGEPFLYDVTCELTDSNHLIDTRATKIGLRSIELVQKEDSIGTSFYLKLNGKPVFMKGANYIPQDNFLPRVTKKKYNLLLKNVVDANMNMLRVWG
ncbi:MAG: glycoside hydrolase family 2 protein, partial [Bacteroidales bacterium]|nr:glycoside hydrolase family 2 protein [Bacteroidales bacterium]